MLSFQSQANTSSPPYINEIVLAVNEQNLTAQRLYLTAGFIDSGRRREGKKGRQLLLYYPLSANYIDATKS
ncbi:GCN5 family acetyltransferase, partial [Geobacillus kaustophilus]|nr:GCN5 family acetyltransferase [Geobacillus kaustophilus]